MTCRVSFDGFLRIEAFTRARKRTFLRLSEIVRIGFVHRVPKCALGKCFHSWDVAFWSLGSLQECLHWDRNSILSKIDTSGFRTSGERHHPIVVRGTTTTCQTIAGWTPVSDWRVVFRASLSTDLTS